MKVAIVSDTHFGYKWDTDRGRDAFDNAREAFQRTVDADIVILPGDIFDKKVPKQEVLGRTVDCFNIYKQGDCTVSLTDESDKSPNFDGTPVVAIHGTHERRARGFINPIELLEKMGYLVHLHGECLVFEQDGEKVAVHGMSGVPERYAPGVLEKIAPEPVEDAYNIFVFHQSVEGLVYTDQEHGALTLEDLPDGFDLLVDGHIHWYNLDHVDSDKPIVLPGSTISTQMRKIEAEKPKGFLTVDTETSDVTFHALETPRTLYYEEIDVGGCSTAEIMQRVRDRMTSVLSKTHEKRPLVRLILTGTTDAAVKLREITALYEGDAILSVSKRFSTEQRDAARAQFDAQTQSVADIGQSLLRTYVDTDLSLDVEELFDLLAEGQKDAALRFVEELETGGESAEAGDDAKESAATPETHTADKAAGERSLAEFSR